MKARILVVVELLAVALIVARLVAPDLFRFGANPNLASSARVQKDERTKFSKPVATDSLKKQSQGVDHSPTVDQGYKPREWTPEYLAAPRFLQGFLELHTRALRRENEEVAYEQFLQDEYLIAETKRFLMAPPIDIREDDESLRTERLYAIDYFEAALEWKENPSRSMILSAIGDVLVQDPLLVLRSEDLKKSLIGDRVELFQMLARLSPNELPRVVQNIKNEAAESILAFAMAQNTADIKEQIANAIERRALKR